VNYLFVYSNALNIGGVQTLIARIAEGLIDSGHSVSAVFFTDVSESVAELLPEECVCLSIPGAYQDRILFPHNCRRWLAEHCGNAEICVVFGPRPLHFVSANLASFRNRPAVISYVVAEMEFTGAEGKLFARFYSHMFFNQYFKRLLPDINKFFVSDAVLRIHEEKLNAKFPNARVTPLPIKTSHQRTTASLRPFRVVSIGRIDAMAKTYNLLVPQVIRELRDEGCEIHWDVYGGGVRSDTEKFSAVIREQGVEECVAWHGELPYSDMGAVLKNATVFLGMGTAALEAAMLGIPTLVAVSFVSEPLCYGFLHEVPYGIYGENGAYWLERYSIKDALSGLYRSSQAEYDGLVELDRNYAMQYASEDLIAQFIEFTKESRSATVPRFPLLWSVFTWLNQLRWRLGMNRRGFAGGSIP
jgi:glycosyltransferase involved in cell wall biosynthesis